MTRWLPFVWASIVTAATAGFGFGAAAFAASAARVPLGDWWTALYQAHGHLQLFGWGGLMVLGVGFFFLPRLRGAPLAAPTLLPWILSAMVGGLALRAVAQPALAVAPESLALRAILAASGVLEFLAITLAVGVLLATAARGPALAQRAGLLPVLPYLATAFASAWLALAINAAAVLQAALISGPALPYALDSATVHLGLVGFLVPVSVAVSARTFPLFLWLRLPSTTLLSGAFLPFLLGLVIRSTGIAAGQLQLQAVGQLLEGASMVAFGVALQVVPPRRREDRNPAQDAHYLKAVEWLLIPAYLWLTVAGLMDLALGVSIFGVALPIPLDAERHALGSGFITLLILGMAARMLPGFAGQRLASRRLVWATVWLGIGSAMLRVAPLLVVGAGGTGTWPFGPPAAALALSGLLGLAAVLCLGTNLWWTFNPGAYSSTSGAPPRAHRKES